MGGPGLNLGMQDGVNLGWKLAAEVNGWAPAGVLDTYESERYPVGERVMMHSQSQIALMAPGPDIAALRDAFRRVDASSPMSPATWRILAGSDVRYDVGDDHPLSGRWCPTSLDDGRRVAELFRDARPVLLDLTDGAASAAAASVDRPSGLGGSCDDRRPAALLIRPDGYVAWATDAFGPDDAQRLRDALARWFGAGRRPGLGAID